MLLDKDSTAETSWENKGKNRGLISHLNNCTAIDRFGYANYLQSAHREYTQHVERSLTDHFSSAGVR